MTAERPGRAFLTACARRPLEVMVDRRSFERGVLYAANGRVGMGTATELSVTETAADPDHQAEAIIDSRAYLSGLDHETLADLLVERAAEDEHFDARLRRSAARAREGAPSIAVFRHALGEAFVIGDHVDYREMYIAATNIESVLDSLRELLDDGHAAAVIALAERAVDRAENALGYVDDSDGWLSTIAERLQELHYDACKATKPEPVALARTHFERDRHSSDLGVFHGPASTYAKLLGRQGHAEYQRLVQAEWDALPPLGSGQEERSYSSRRFWIMHTLAELTGDVDAGVDVLARDQSSAYQFVRSAELYTKAGRYDDTLAWVERGLALHGASDSRLVKPAADEHHRAGGSADAVRVAWDAYETSPALHIYRQLAEEATRAGLWPDCHEKSLVLLRERVAHKDRKPAGCRVTSWAAPGIDSSTLVEVLRYDGDVEQAWTESRGAGCRRDCGSSSHAAVGACTRLRRFRSGRARSSGTSTPRSTRRTPETVDLVVWVRRLMIAADHEARLPAGRSCVRPTSPSAIL